MSVKEALLANFLSALSCYIGLVIGIYVGQEGEVRFWIFAVAGGVFLYVALVDMVSHILCLFFQGGGGSSTIKWVEKVKSLLQLLAWLQQDFLGILGF